MELILLRGRRGRRLSTTGTRFFTSCMKQEWGLSLQHHPDRRRKPIESGMIESNRMYLTLDLCKRTKPEKIVSIYKKLSKEIQLCARIHFKIRETNKTTKIRKIIKYILHLLSLGQNPKNWKKKFRGCENLPYSERKEKLIFVPVNNKVSIYSSSMH